MQRRRTVLTNKDNKSRAGILQGIISRKGAYNPVDTDSKFKRRI
jgi:hypothetical protein